MLAKEIEIRSPYEPRPLQEYIHSHLKRFNVIVTHRGFGKTILVCNELLHQALTCPQLNPIYLYIAPTFTAAERIAWASIKHYAKDLPGVVFNETKLTCTIPRPHRGDSAKIMLLGAETPDNARGLHVNGCVLDEYGTMNPVMWSKIIRPAVTNRKGFVIFIGTSNGKNHFYDIYQTALANVSGEWWCAIFRASQTKVLPQSELDALKAEMSEDEYLSEMECSFTAALTGAYWGKQVDEVEQKGRITLVDHDPALTVSTYWDLGLSDSTAIWFVQTTGHEVRLIEYFEASGEGLEFYALKLKEGHRAKYNYGAHYWPHDGGSRDLSSGQERSSTMRKLVSGPLYVQPRYDVADSINASRRLLVKCWFDRAKTARGLDCLRSYQKKWDPKNKLWMDHPKHDWSSHGADAFRLLAMALRPGDDRSKKDLPRQVETRYDIFKRG